MRKFVIPIIVIILGSFISGLGTASPWIGVIGMILTLIGGFLAGIRFAENSQDSKS